MATVVITVVNSYRYCGRQVSGVQKSVLPEISDGKSLLLTISVGMDEPWRTWSPGHHKYPSQGLHVTTCGF